MTEDVYAPAYDSFAHIYDKHFGSISTERYFSALQTLQLGNLPKGSKVLDVCCGTGDLAKKLNDNGFDVTGMDISTKMLEHAQAKAPEVKFMREDIRSFSFNEQFSAAISLFDSINQITNIAKLQTVFKNILNVLKPGGSFLFDISTGKKFKDNWQGIVKVDAADHCFIADCKYDEQLNAGVSEITVFNQASNQHWNRRSQILLSKNYSLEEIATCLYSAGFDAIEHYDSERDLGIKGEEGRLFIHCHKANY